MYYLFIRIKQNINWFILGIIVIGFALRVFNLSKHDFWFDEVLTHKVISGSYIGTDQEFYTIFLEKNPPFYYGVLRQWSCLFGLSEFSLRFFSVVFSVLSIFFLYKLVILFFDKITALIAAGLMAFSPFQIWYAQEARMFTLALFLVIASVYFFLKALEGKRKLYWVIYCLTTVCLISTTYHAFFLFVPEFIIVLYAYKRSFLKWLLSVSVAALIFILTIFSQFMSQFISLQNNFWLSSIIPRHIPIMTMVNLIVGYNTTLTIYRFVLFIMIGLFFSVFIIQRRSKSGLFFVLFCIVPVISIFLFTKTIAPIYVHRHFIIISPFLYICLAQGITSIKYRIAKIGIISIFLLILSLCLFNYYADRLPLKYPNQAVFIKKPVRRLVNFFIEHKENGDVLGFGNYGFMVTFSHYLDQVEKNYSGIKRFYFYKRNKDLYYERKKDEMLKYSFKLNHNNNIDIDSTDFKEYGLRKIWVFYTSWERNDNLSPNDQAIKEWFDQKFIKLKEWYIDGVWIGVYQISRSLSIS